MKRIIGIVLIVSILLSAFSLGFTALADYMSEALAATWMSFSKSDVLPGEEIEMTVMLQSDSDIEIGCIQFYVNYFGMSYPFMLDEASVELPEMFDTAMVAQSSSDVPVKFIWDSTDNVSIEAYETVELGKFKLKVHEDAVLGEYRFNIHFDVLSSFSLETGEFVDVTVLENEYADVFVGNRLDVGGNLIKVPAGGSEDYAYEIVTNKLLNHEETYIENENVAEIVEIIDYQENSVIRVRGKMLGENTTLYLTSTDETFDDSLMVTIQIVKPMALFITRKTEPIKTVYYVGEKCDKQTLLEGLTVKVDYENYDVKIFENPDDFILDEYDFSTPGQKRVKVYCDNTYTTITYTVKETPQYISSNVYSANATEIFDVPENTSVEEFIANTNVSDRIKVYDVQGNPVTEGIVTTGMKAEFVLDNEVKASALISVKYDVDCDGKVGIKDLMLCKKAALGDEELLSAQLKAIGGVANAQALVQIKNYILQ